MPDQPFLPRLVRMPNQPHTGAAVDALRDAVHAEPDFAGWLASVLAMTAATEGSSWALVEGRPGSWEAALVLQLVRGTVGNSDENLHIWASLDGDPQ